MTRYFAYMTASVVFADGTDENGWVEFDCDFDLEESRNYVTPKTFTVSNVESIDDRDEFLPDVASWVKDILESELGAFEPSGNGDGTFYGQDEKVDDTGASWIYAIHFSAVDAILTGSERQLTADELGSLNI